MHLFAAEFFLLTATFTSALAKTIFTFTNSAFTGIKHGSPFTICWSGDGTPATIALMTGYPTSLRIVATLATDLTTSSYVWTPSTSLPAGQSYALAIWQNSHANYSPMFTLGASQGAKAQKVLVKARYLSVEDLFPSYMHHVTATGVPIASGVGRHDHIPKDIVQGVSGLNSNSTAYGAYSGAVWAYATGTSRISSLAYPTGGLYSNKSQAGRAYLVKAAVQDPLLDSMLSQHVSAAQQIGIKWNLAMGALAIACAVMVL